MRLFPSLLLILLLAASRPAFAVEKIDWEILVPPLDYLTNPTTHLSSDLQLDLYNLSTVRKRKAAGRKSAGLDSLEKRSIERLQAAGYSAEVLLREMADYARLRQANNFRLVRSLNGKEVKLAGYLLPTEFDGDKMTEFLLVPTFGACIHTPAPPRNQLVHVKLQKGIESLGLFSAVEVTGRLSTAGGQYSASYADGDIAVDAGYSIDGVEVVLYDD